MRRKPKTPEWIESTGEKVEAWLKDMSDGCDHYCLSECEKLARDTLEYIKQLGLQIAMLHDEKRNVVDGIEHEISMARNKRGEYVRGLKLALDIVREEGDYECD